MEISFLGHSSFRIKVGNYYLITDPFDPDFVGLPFPKQKTDIVTLSHSHKDHDYVDGILGPMKRESLFVISQSGQYEIGGVEVRAIPSFHDDKKGEVRGDNLIMAVYAEEMSLVHLGDLGHELSEKQIEEIGLVDVLMIPVGGEFTINAKQAVELLNRLQPSVVIPMHYQARGLNKEFEKLTGVDEFIKEGEFEDVVHESKLKLKKESLPEDTQVVVMEI